MGAVRIKVNQKTGQARRQILISCWQRGEFALTVCRESKAGSDILRREVREFVEQFLLAHSASEIFEDIGNSHAGAADTWFSAALARLNSNDSSVVDLRHKANDITKQPRAKGRERDLYAVVVELVLKSTVVSGFVDGSLAGRPSDFGSLTSGSLGGEVRQSAFGVSMSARRH